jgi:hypothetical protein
VSNIDLTVADIFEAKPMWPTACRRHQPHVDSWMQTNAQLLAALRNQTVSNNLIRSFVVIIVALGIASVLVVSVVQKQKEIGILRAMGASRRMIMAGVPAPGGASWARSARCSAACWPSPCSTCSHHLPQRRRQPAVCRRARAALHRHGRPGRHCSSACCRPSSPPAAPRSMDPVQAIRS